MAIGEVKVWYDILGGENTQHTDRLKQDRKLMEMTKASNVIPDPAGELVTSPGFSEVRSSAMGSATTAVTGMFHMGDLADEFILVGDDGEHYRDNANPPGAITGGTDFTAGDTVLVRGTIFGDVLITVSSSRDAPQAITAAISRADLGGTPPKGVDVKSFGRRVWMFSPDVSGTIYRHLASFNSEDDDETKWTNPITVNFLNFGTPGGKFNVLGGEVFEDHLMVFTEDSVFPVYQTSNFDIPFQYQDDVLDEEGGGPSSIHSVVKGDKKLAWISRNFDVKLMLPNKQIASIGYPVQPFLRGLNDSRRGVIVGGWEPQFRMFVWCMSDGSDTENQTAMMYHVDTKQFFFRTISRNAFANRIVSGEVRLIGGGYDGKFYNEFDSSTTGNLDDATAAIDADIQTPRMHLGLPDMRKRVPFVEVEFDPIGSETVTVQYRLDDATSWSSFSETASVSGTDVFRKRFFFGKPFRRVQLRFRNNTSGERFRITKYGFPAPTAMFPSS